MAAVLRRTVQLLSLPDADVSLTRYESADELRNEFAAHLHRVEDGADLSDGELLSLQMLFAPTSSLQDVSIGSGWGEEFLALADRFDEAVASA
jgi:hypothetical protein